MTMDRPQKRRRMDHSLDKDVEELRARNNARLKTTFDSIFEKYGRDFSGIGDEIDLETGKVLVNNGHLLGMKDETDAGADGDMFDELASEPWSDRLKLGKEVDFQSDTKAGNGQEPANGPISEVSCIPDDHDSLMGDIIVPGLLEAVGSGSPVSRLPDIQPESENWEPLSSPIADGHGMVYRERPLDTDFSARPLKDTEIVPWEDADFELSWRPPSPPEPVSVPIVQPAPIASGDNSAGSKRSPSPTRSFLGTSTNWKGKPRFSPMNRWTQQEDDLLLCLLSDTTLGYPEVKAQFNKRFPHRHLQAIQYHWNRLRGKDPWKSVLDGRIHKHTIAKRCQLKASPIPGTVKEDQYLCSSEGHAYSNDSPTPDHASDNAGKGTVSSESSPYRKMNLQPDIQQYLQANDTPTPKIDTNTEFLSHRLREHGRFVSALSRPPMVERDVRLTATQKVYRSTTSEVEKELRADTTAGLDINIDPKPIGTYGDSESPTTAETDDTRNPIVYQNFKFKAKSHRAPKITAMRQAYAMRLSQRVASSGSLSQNQDLFEASINDTRVHDNHDNHTNNTKVAREPSVAATLVPGNPNPSTSLLNLLSPKIVSTPCKDPDVNRKEHGKALPYLPIDPQLLESFPTSHTSPHANYEKYRKTTSSLSASRQFPRSSKIPRLQRSGLFSEPENRLGSSGLSEIAGRECNESLTSSVPVTRRKSADELNKAPRCAPTVPAPPSASLTSKATPVGAVQLIDNAAKEKKVVEKQRAALSERKAEEDNASKEKKAIFTLDSKPRNSRADEASRAIKLSDSATTLPLMMIRTHTPSQAKRHIQGVTWALAKPISPPETDTSDDELSTPIKTVGTSITSRFISVTSKNRRKTELKAAYR